MQYENNSPDLFNNEMEFDPMAKQYIRSMAGWAMIIVVVAVIGYVLNILELFGRHSRYAGAEGFDMGFSRNTGSSDTFSTVFFVIIGLLINFFLFRFATQARAAVDGLDQSKLNSSFNNLKAYFMACSIVLIIVFVYVLLIAVVFGARSV